MSFLKNVFHKSSHGANEEQPPLSPEEATAVLSQLKQSHIKLAEDALKLIVEIAASGPERKWTVWEESEGGNFRIEKSSVSLSQSVCGRATMLWNSKGEYQMDLIEDYLWDGGSKEEYDEHSEKMIKLISHGDNVTVMNQVFKGRFGLAGRDFMICCSKARRDTATHNVLIITAKSVPTEEEPIIERVMREESKEAHARSKAKNVRGTIFIAGFLVENKIGTDDYRAVYINDVAATVMGVPQWIVNRVKLDQLKILQQIPTNLSKKAAHKKKVDAL